ncbi:hypothetical protein AMR72_12130 [Flavobacterium psychrophilum]|nr:hypothetical protein AMR72_12130 [Flavobacterium psychrophilum]AOE53201.1 hypothetical protein ALW18_12120 [Flavobacterium psychrophilum]
MPLSDKNIHSLMLDIHNSINDYSSTLSEDITYPPGSELNDAEKEELHKLSSNDVLKSALKKIIANTAADVVFNIFSVIDGVTDPQGEWTGVTLVDTDENHEPEQMLHDTFYETYWDWKESNQ